MDSERKKTLLIGFLFLGFLMGTLELGKILDPYTLHTVTFRGKETRVVVYANRRAIAVENLAVKNEILERDGNFITRTTIAVPRRGIHTWTGVASNDEVELFHRFF